VAVAMAMIVAVGGFLAGDAWAAVMGAAFFAGALVLSRPFAWRPIRRLAALIHPRAALLVERLLSSFAEVPNRTLIYLIAHTVVYNLLVITYLALCFRAVGVTAPCPVLAVALVLIQVAGLVPVTFAGVGLREGAAVVLLAGYGDPAALLAGGLWATVVDQILFPVAGLAFFPPFLADLLRPRPTETN